MASIEAFTFTTEQFLGLLGAIGAAVFFIAWRIRGVEKDIEHAITKNPYLKAFRELEEKHAKELAERFDKTLNTWEAEKKVSSSEEMEKKEDTSK